MIEIKNFEIGYENKIIAKNINLILKPHKIYGLIGRNGAGKTTFLKTIARLHQERNGEIIFAGKQINHMDYFDLDVTFVGDDHAFFQDLTMYEQLIFLCKLNKMTKNDAEEKISYLIKRFRLEEYMNYYPHACSRGTIQRFGLVCGYLRNSKLFLLDEPFITLDPIQVRTFENLLVEYKNENAVMIVSSHDLDSLEKICDEYLVIHHEQIHHFPSNEIDTERITELIGDSYA